MARTRSRRRPPSEAVLSLRELPLELQLHVASELGERTDRAAFCLALPPLGCAALRGLAEYREDILMSVALRLPRLVPAAKHTLLDERLLRFYVADRRATHDGCLWLNAAFAAVGVDLQVQVAGDGEREWRLMAGPELSAMLRRVRPSGVVIHFEGEKGAERMVRMVDLMGFVIQYVIHFEGERGTERKVRAVDPSGVVIHYEGEQGAERKVRAVDNPSGVAIHYEGEQGAERTVRAVQPSGVVMHYEGEKGAERVVRMVHSSGVMMHYEGEPGAERAVHAVDPSGAVTHYEGEQGAERKVRMVHPSGVVIQYEGEQGERVL